MNYSEALKGDAPIIMGIRLRPLSLGALIHLFNEKCAVVDVKRPLSDVTGGKDQTKAWVKWAITEMRKALLICAMTFEDYKDLQFHPEDRKEIYRKWDATIIQMTWNKQFDLFDSIKMFNEYLNEAFIIPPHTPIRVGRDNAPASSPSKENWFHPFILELGESLSMTETAILNRPWELTKLDYYGLAAKKGAIALKGDAEQELINALGVK